MKIKFLIREDQMREHRVIRHFWDLELKPLALKRLHAKIYISDKQALLTSMNLLAGSRESVEFGLRIDRQRHAELYQAVFRQAYNLLKKSESVELPSPKPRAAAVQNAAPVQKAAPVKASTPPARAVARVSVPAQSAGKEATSCPEAHEEALKRLSQTQAESYRLWRTRGSVHAVAKERDRAMSTIRGHLAAAIEVGLVGVEDVVAEKQRALISEAVGKVGPDAEIETIVKTSRGSVCFGEVACVLAAMRVLRERRAHQDDAVPSAPERR